MRTSPIWMGPIAFLVMMRPLSRPSSTRTLTCVASPVIPVRPMISTTSAGMPDSVSSSAIGNHLLAQRRDGFRDLADDLLAAARVRDGDGGRGDFEAGGRAQLLLAGDV